MPNDTATRPKCPDCGSQDLRYRSTTNTMLCRHCGARWDRDTGKVVKP